LTQAGVRGLIILGSEQEATAFRVAGHILIGCLIGKTTVRTTIDPSEIGALYQNQFVGRVWVDPLIYPDDLNVDDQQWSEVACREVAFNLAGLVVESIRMGRVFDEVWDGIQEGYVNNIGLAPDWIDAWLTCYADGDYDELHTRLWVHGIYKDAEALLKDYWPLVELLAKALLRQGTLTGDEIVAVLSGVSDRTQSMLSV
jgi:hypothetical protein